MNNRALAILFVALLASVWSGPAIAQESNCFTDVVNYLACYEENYDLRIWRIDSDGEGVELGVISGNIYPYAAAVYSQPQLVTRVVGPSGYYVEMHFTGKQLADVNGYDTTWTMIMFDPAGNALSLREFTRRTHADASVGGGFAVAATGTSSAATTVITGPVVPFVGEYEPSIIQQGTVAECLVTSTYTVRMRSAPTTGAAVLDRVPYSSAMPADMITADGQWARAFFVGEGGTPNLGWIFTRYLDLSEACEGLTTVAPLTGTGVMVAAPAVPEVAADEEQVAADESMPVDPTYGGVIDLAVVSPGSVDNCLVRTNYTVRMRMAPLATAPVLDNIPYRSAMPADLVTTDGAWVRAFYLGKLGWIASEYLSLSEACDGLNGIAPVQ